MSSARDASLADALAALLALPAKVDEQMREIHELRAQVTMLAAAVGRIVDVDLETAAAANGESVATTRRKAAAGELPGAYRRGRSWRVRLGASSANDEIGELAAAARAEART